MRVANVYVAGGNDIGVACNTAYLSADGKSNTRQEIKHTSANVLVGKLHIENDGAVVKKMLCNAYYVLIFFGTNDL